MIVSGRDCFGCGACAAFCPHEAISMQRNYAGFLTPVLQETRCTQCGFCSRICPLEWAPRFQTPLAAYAGWSRDDAVRRRCSSGGIACELSRLLLARGFRVCAVAYSPETRIARHELAGSPEELERFCGSKYLQSHTVAAFQQLKVPGRFLVVGTPCQIAALRLYLRAKRREEDFILVDFFCHGVPSAALWEKYLDLREHDMPGRVQDVQWRCKDSGWHDSWNIRMQFDHGNGATTIRNFRKRDGDIFYRMFLGNFCQAPACYDSCRFKACSSEADIRLGDLWGRKYAAEQQGVSGILAMTPRGQEVLSQLSSCQIHEEPLAIVQEEQMRHRAVRPWGSRLTMWLLQSRCSLKTSCRIIVNFNRFMTLPQRAVWRLGRRCRKTTRTK